MTPLPSDNQAVAQKRFETFQRLRTDLPYFAEHVLKIRDKSGALMPFKLNKAQ
jgi:hypothetical protein